MDDATKLIQALSAAAWPALVFFVVWTYRRQVAGVIESAKGRKVAIEVGGQKLTLDEANHQQQELIADLQKQVLDLRARVEGVRVSPEAALADEPPGGTRSTAVLWVDDNPKNNSYFIELLQQRGYQVDLALTTAQGLALADATPYRVVLSDMGREGGRFSHSAGMVLLDALRNRGSTVPVVFYCAERNVTRHRERAKELGARAITASGTELRALLDALAPGTVE